jgi:ribonucleoside-triphosphate reductase
VRYDNLNYSDVKQVFQEFVFNINIPTRVGFQTPFTNITLDLHVPSVLKKEPIIIGGVERKETYGDFQTEMGMINRAFAEVMMEGDAKGRVFTFPIPTYNITKGFDWQNPNHEIIWKMTGKYGIPYFSNFVKSDLSPDDVRSMCCRVRLDTRELLRRGGGLFGAHPLTGSIGVVTINMPRTGCLSKNKSDFFKRLRKRVFLAAGSLSIKRKVLERLTESDLYPYAKFYLRDIKTGRKAYWKHHFSTIGIIGMNEACLNFMGVNIASERGLKFSLEIMDFIRSVIADIQEETGHIFNLEATPAEGASHRLAMLIRRSFPISFVPTSMIIKMERRHSIQILPNFLLITQMIFSKH